MGLSSGNKSHSYFTQIWTAIAVSYLTSSGGLMIGYTSSAINSLQETPADDSVLNSLRRGFGFNIPNVNLTSNASYKNEESMYKEFNELNDEQASWIGSLLPLGCAGCLINPFLNKMFGSRGTILKIAYPLCILSWALIALADNLWFIYFGRFIAGLSFGITRAVGSVYITQICSENLRGPLLILPLIFTTSGILAGYAMGTFFAWRFTAIIFGAFFLPNIAMLLFTPLENTKQQQNHSERNPNPEKGNDSQLKEEDVIWPTSATIKCVACVFALMGMQQFCGASVVQSYTVLIFQAAFANNEEGSSASPSSTQALANYCSIIISAIYIISSTLACWLIQRLGRKVLLNYSIIIIALSQFTLGLFFYIQSLKLELESNSGLAIFLQWLPVSSLIVFIASYGVGFGAICYPLSVELLSPKLRPQIFPLASSFNWLSYFFVAKTYSRLVSLLSTYGTFWLYGITSLVALVFILCCVPETKDKDEKSIMEFYSSNRKGKEDFYD